MLTVTLTVEELLAMPCDAIFRILDKAAPGPEFLQQCREWETRPDHGKGRWPLLNYLRQKL